MGLRVGGGELVARVRSGDRAALGELYTDFVDRIYGFCFTLLRDRDEAADATQDTFVLAFQRLDQLRDPERLTSWMFAIARHVCLGQLGQRDRIKPVEAVPDVALADDEPADAVLASEAAALVWAAASGLNKRDRAILFLNTRQGLEGAELTAALGLNHANPYSLVSRAKRQLERAIGLLLVARFGRRTCEPLAAMLNDWDGALTPLTRKRLGRHVDGCETCRATRVRALASAALVSASLLAPDVAGAAPAGRSAEDFLNIAARRPVSAGRWQRDGFPPAVHRRARRRFAVLGVVCLLVLGASNLAGASRSGPSRPASVPRPATHESEGGRLATDSIRPPVHVAPSVPLPTTRPSGASTKVVVKPPADIQATPAPTVPTPTTQPSVTAAPTTIGVTTTVPKPPPPTTTIPTPPPATTIPTPPPATTVPRPPPPTTTVPGTTIWTGP